MTQERILTLAYNDALRIWFREHERLEELPGNKITQIKERRAWAELQEIEAMLKEARQTATA